MPTIVYDDVNGHVTVTAAETLVTLQMAGFNSVQFQVTEEGNASTIIYETSNNETDWVPCVGIAVDYPGNPTPVTFTQTTGMWTFPRMGRFFRARVSAYNSGNVTIWWVQSQQPVFISTGQTA